MSTNKNRTLVQVCASLEPKLGGPPRVIKDTFTRLSATFNTSLIVFGNTDLHINGLIHIPTLFNNRYGFCIEYPKRQLRDTLNNADIILIHGFYLYSTLIAILHSRTGLLFVMPHGSLETFQEAQGRMRKKIFCLFLRIFLRGRAIHFLVASQSERDSVISKFPNSTVTVVGLGVNIRIPVELNHTRSFNEIRLFCLSRITEVKRIDLSIKATAILREQDERYKLDIYGEGDSKLTESLLQLRSNLGLEDHVNFFGFVDNDKKLEVLVNSDILLLPSENENFAIAAAEAVAAGRPVVVYKNVGFHDFVDRYKTGVTIDTLDEFSVASAIKVIVDDYCFYQQNCLNHAVQLSWDTVIAKWIAELEKKFDYEE